MRELWQRWHERERSRRRRGATFTFNGMTFIGTVEGTVEPAAVTMDAALGSVHHFTYKVTTMVYKKPFTIPSKDD